MPCIALAGPAAWVSQDAVQGEDRGSSEHPQRTYSFTQIPPAPSYLHSFLIFLF